ncbi:hypothetical protein H5410_026134 [Solanum commersonii]|uniref:Uncharacterized protein n=1 Tax=Solanum commersonii TaxID=4109 RepID=A0A9J5YW63_SOLCO|nr:hypothetical protein H5410_026134 [Solanum commersonii]
MVFPFPRLKIAAGMGKKVSALKINMKKWYIQARYIYFDPLRPIFNFYQLKCKATTSRLLTKERMLHLNIHVDNEMCCLCRNQVMET